MLGLNRRDLVVSIFWLVLWSFSHEIPSVSPPLVFEVETKAGRTVTPQEKIETNASILDTDITILDTTNGSISNTNISNELSTIPITAKLQYPFRIVQAGVKRTGSTFQREIISKIARMRTPKNRRTGGGYCDGIKCYQKSISEGRSFVHKTHNFELLPLLNDLGIVIFTSNYDMNLSLYTQWTDNFHVCSLCEVDKYKDIFDLSEPEIAEIRNYMSNWEILRKCCGDQSSKYHIAELNGCSVTQYTKLPTYPMCEHYNMTDVEQKFCEDRDSDCNFDFNPQSQASKWRGPGDCARIDKLISEKSWGIDAKRFQGCDNLQDRLFA